MKPSPDTTGHPARILIVDDELHNRDVLEVMLAAEGFFVQTAAGGEEALAIVAQQPPDLILLDVLMPKMDGFEVTGHIKRNPATKNIPVILITGLGDGDFRIRGLGAGAEDFLTKPFDLAELRMRVRNLLRLKAYGDFYSSYSQTLEEEVTSRTADLVERTKTLEEQTVVLADQAVLLQERTREIAQALEGAEQASRAKDALLMTVSHELRTPLNAILGWSDVLERRPDPALVCRGLPVIKRNALVLTQAVENLLDVSMAQTGAMRLDTRPTDLRAVLSGAIEVVRPAAEAKRISIVSTGDQIPAIVLGDPIRLRQALWNLLSNAVKFSPEEGSVCVNLQASEERVRLEVSDSGIGIESGFLPRVFEGFSQADTSTTREHSGLGLGLTIVRQLVEMHGGTVQALSGGSSHGAAFTIELPAHRAIVGAPSPGETAIEPAEVADLSGVRVLVVDDDSDSRGTVALILEAAGASTLQAESASTGLHSLLQHDVDVVLSDILMPRRDGIAFIQDVRSLPDEVKCRTPAVALTALAHDEDHRSILAAGFQKCVVKPVSADRLVRSVATAASSRPVSQKKTIT